MNNIILGIVPQMIILIAVITGIILRIHTRDRDKFTINAYYTIIISFVYTLLLYLGGFFVTLRWPQWTIIILIIFNCYSSLNYHNEEIDKISDGNAFLCNIIFILILYLGGFFDVIITSLNYYGEFP